MSTPFDEMTATLWVLIHPDLRRAARIRAFVAFVVAELEKLRPLLEGQGTRATKGQGAQRGRRR